MAAIELVGLTKRFSDITAVDDLNLELTAGTITGFLGPNGAGKTTTLRMLLGLVAPTSGRATFDGLRYAQLPDPARQVGALLEASSYHPGRRAIDHLRVLASAARLPDRRAHEALEQVGLAASGRRRVGGFSLGMRQRLGFAAALIGEPSVLILDEPTNGLDPDGVRWLREFLRGEADRGVTVVVSSHLLAEVAQTVDHVVILDHGQLVTSASLAELTARTTSAIVIRTPDAELFARSLEAHGLSTDLLAPDRIRVNNTTPEHVSRVIAGDGLVVYEMHLERSNLEDIYLALTQPERSRT